MASIEQDVGNLLRQKGLTLGIVESATGGLISHLLTNAPGSSNYYRGAVIAYSDEVKIKVVGVKEGTIKKGQPRRRPGFPVAVQHRAFHTRG